MSKSVLIQRVLNGDTRLEFVSNGKLEGWITSRNGQLLLSGVQFGDGLQAEYSAINNTILKAGKETNILVGSTKQHRSLTIDYLLERKDQGTPPVSRFQYGVVRILYNGVGANYMDDFIDDGTDIGVIFTAKIVRDQIYLVATTSQTDHNCKFKANIVKISK